MGPLGIVDGRGLSPFLGDRSLTANQYLDICLATARVVNRLMVEDFYSRQNKYQDAMDKLSTLIYDGWMESTIQDDQESDKEDPEVASLRVMSAEDAGQVQSSWEYHMRLRNSPKKRFVKYSVSLNQPGMQALMAYLLELTFSEATKQPEQISVPSSVEWDHERTFLFIRDSVKALDAYVSSVPDVLD